MQCGDITAEGLATCAAEAHSGARFTTGKVFLHQHITGWFQGQQMRAEVAVGGLDDRA